MARVKLLEKQETAPEVKEIFEKLEANRARVLNLYKAIAQAPTAAPPFMKLGNALLVKAELPPNLRELAILRIARLTGSGYEWRQHVPVALDMGVTQAQIDAADKWKESAAYGDTERAVLQYVDEVMTKPEVADSTFESLRRHLSERSTVELTLSVGYWNMVAKVLVALKVDLDKQSVTSGSDFLGKGRKP